MSQPANNEYISTPRDIALNQACLFLRPLAIRQLWPYNSDLRPIFLATYYEFVILNDNIS